MKRTTLLLSILVIATPVSLIQAQQTKAKPAAATTVEKPWPDAAGMAARKREAERLRLFRSEEPIVATLAADFRAVMRDRNPESTTTFPAKLTFPGADGKTLSLPLRIRTRGHSRRNPGVCSFAPLRLEFDKTQTKGTVFDGHGGLKLGTHCRKGAEDVILREYAIYKMFNLLTPRSFRARVAKMTYVDSVTGKLVADEAGLFIEDDDDVAKRLEGRIVAVDKAVFARVDLDTLTLMMLFEYMIGNTDLSVYLQHNVRLVETQPIKRYPVPYDFDYSGLADSGYGVVARGLPIPTVRDRLYRGPCRTLAEWQPYLDKVKAVKPQILGLFDTVAGLSPSYRRSAKSYLEEFYKTIDQPSLVKRALIETCEKVGM
jgi:hypothetical protein